VSRILISFVRLSILTPLRNIRTQSAKVSQWMPGVSGGGEPPEPVTDGASKRGRCVYWLKVFCSMSDSGWLAKESPRRKGLLSDIGYLVQNGYIRGGGAGGLPWFIHKVNV
jgi:hypothetical protein